MSGKQAKGRALRNKKRIEIYMSIVNEWKVIVLRERERERREKWEKRDNKEILEWNEECQ